MDGPTSSLLKQIFVAALEVHPDKLPAFLTEACGENAAMRAEIEALLRSHRSEVDFFDPTVTSFSESTVRPPDGVHGDRFQWMLLDEQPGSSVDRYKLLEVIGKGGHGVVFRAEQEQPIRRKVALKVIRKGLETDAVRLRFEAERQTLALMDHPNIAKLFDAGTTEQGRPYFVMELVPGLPLTRFCDQHRLSIRDRVGLFITVCRAVHHAHQKGVIHRDLKPSNILVSDTDGSASPKVIDFGISRATSDAYNPADDLQIIGTPQYMSPEQVATQNTVVDIRSDIYSLGAIFFELLTGSTPIQWSGVIRTVQDLRETLAKHHPMKPSDLLTKIASSSDAQSRAKISGDRNTTSPILLTSLKEDLDWIALKATHPDRALRYESVAALAEDLQRYLERRPVLAAPAIASYLLRRFAARNKTAVILAMAVAICVMVSLCAVTLGLLQARKARDRAIIAQQREAKLEAQAIAAEKLQARAETDAIERLRDSLIQQARSGERSRVPGQRTASLKAIALAARMAPTEKIRMELRNEAMACMSLPDVELTETWPMQDYGTFMCFSENMDRYAVSDHNGSVRIVRMSDRTQLAVLPGPNGRLSDIFSFSPDSKYLVTRDSAGLHLWDVAARKALLNRGSPVAWAFTKDSGTFVVGSETGSLDLYSLPQLVMMKSVAGVGRAEHCRLSPDQSRLAVWGGDTGLKMVPTIHSDEIKTIKTDVSPIMGLAWHPEGHNIALAGYESLGRIEIVNADTGKLQATMIGHVGTPVEVGFTNNGRFLLSTGWDYQTMLWDSASGNQLLTIERCGEGLQIADDDSKFTVSGPMNHQMWRFTTEPEFRSLAGEIEDVGVTSIDINPDSTLLAAATKVGVRIWNLRTGRTYCFVSLPGPRTVLFSPDGSRLFTSLAQGIRQFKVADLAGRKDQPVDPVSDGFTSAIAASADFRTMVFGTPDGTVRVANPESLDKSAALGRQIRPPRFVAVSATGDWAATSSRWEKPKVWSLKTRTLVKELPISPNMIEAGEVAFDPQGKVLITSDCLAYRWYSVGDWKLVRTLNRSQGNAGVEAFSPDGKLLVAAGTGFTYQLLDAQTGAELATIHAPICAIRFSRDSKLLALGGASHEVLLWDLQSVRRNLASMNLDWK